MILMKSSFWLSNLLASVRDSYLILSRASEELEMSSLRKISLFGDGGEGQWGTVVCWRDGNG